MKSQVVAVILTYLAGSAIAAPTAPNGRDIDSLQAATKHVAVENKVVNEIFDKFMGSVTKRDENESDDADDATGTFSGLVSASTPTPTPVSTPLAAVTGALNSLTGGENPLNSVTNTLGGVTGGGNPLNAVTGQLGTLTGGDSPLGSLTGGMGGSGGTLPGMGGSGGTLPGLGGSGGTLPGLGGSGGSINGLTGAVNSLATQATPILGLITGLVIPLLQGLLQGLLGGLAKRDNIVNFGREDLARLGVSDADIDMLQATLRTPLRARADSPAFVPGRLTDYGLPKDVATKLLAAGPEKVFAAVMALTEKGPDGKLQFSRDKLTKLGYSEPEIRALTKSDPVAALTAVTQLSNDTKSGPLTEQLQMLAPVTEGLTGTDGGKGDTLSQLGNIAGGAAESLQNGFGGSVASGLDGVFNALGKGFTDGQSGHAGVSSAPAPAAAAQPKRSDVIMLLRGLGSQLGMPSKRAVPTNNKMITLFTNVQQEAMAMGRTFATYLKKADDGSIVFDEKKVDPNGADVKQFYAPESAEVMVRLMNQILLATGNKIPEPLTMPSKRDTLPINSGPLDRNGQLRDQGSIVGNLVKGLLQGITSHAKRSTPDPTKDISYNMNDNDFPKNIPQSDLPQAKPGAKPDPVGTVIGLALAAIGAHKRGVTPDPTKDISYNMDDNDFPKNIPQADLPQAKPGAKPDPVGQAIGLALAAIGAHKRGLPGVDGDFPPGVSGDIPMDATTGLPIDIAQAAQGNGLLTSLIDAVRGIIDGKSIKVPPAVVNAALNGDTDTLIAYGSKPDGGLIGALKGLLSA